MASQRGFVVQATYRMEGVRPVVYLYGRLEDGRPFLVRDRRQVPHLYVEERQGEAARPLSVFRLAPTDQMTLTGEPVVRVELSDPASLPSLRKRMASAGIATYEADVRFAVRYLIERGIRGSLVIEGAGHALPDVGVVFDDPVTAPSDWTPQLRVLALDIETDPAARRLLSVALYGCGAAEVLLLTPDGATSPDTARPCASEKEILTTFARRVRELDPDVITGWNVIGFDLAVLARIAGRCRVPLELGRGSGSLRIRDAAPPRGAPQASVPGRAVLDGIQLLRSAFVRRDDYSLDAVARDVLGEGKTLSGGSRADEIVRLFKEDRARFVEYNLTDARLALTILERLRLVELTVERTRLTGLPPDRLAGSIAAFDFLYLAELGRRRIVAPSVREVDVAEAQAGGHVLEPLPGLYRNVVVLDFKSLYPSLIRTFEIDPVNLVRPEAGGRSEADPIVAPNGAAFSRQKSILATLLDEMMPRREAARRAGDEVTSQAVKILMNSFYGVLGTPACRFYDPRLANAITSFGREMLLWCKARIETEGRRVLYGDTDSLFVESGIDDDDAARTFGRELTARLNRDLARHIAERWRVESRLELVFDRLYSRLCLPAMRHSGAGARKRYAGLVAGAAGQDGTVVFTGMEAVRSDWTALAKEIQREVYSRLFHDQPLADYVRDVVTRLRAGELDVQLVYRKALRKAPSDYKSTTPPQVAVARTLGKKSRGRVAYVITTEGPEPADARRAPLDYAHYEDKQVRAVVEPVLALLGLDFDEIVGSKKQLRLF
jgi:DNA polymerase II